MSARWRKPLGRDALSRRSEELFDEATERSRTAIRRRRESLVAAARPIVHTAVAASGAWFVAHDVVGHARPFFAPVAAVITLGLAVGRRRRRAVEMAIGVAVGIGVADALVLAIGTGTLQIAVVVVVAMTAALLVGGGPLLATQAATSAVLVATLQPPSGAFSFQRSIDALIGGAVALVVATLVLPVNPVDVVRRAIAPVLDGLARALEEIGGALELRDMETAEEAVVLARAIEPDLLQLREALEAARETRASRFGRHAHAHGSSATRRSPRRSSWPSTTCACSRAGPRARSRSKTPTPLIHAIRSLAAVAGRSSTHSRTPRTSSAPRPPRSKARASPTRSSGRPATCPRFTSSDRFARRPSTSCARSASTTATPATRSERAPRRALTPPAPVSRRTRPL